MATSNLDHPIPDLTALLYNPGSSDLIVQSDMGRISYGFPNGGPSNYQAVTDTGFAALGDYLAVDFVRNNSNPDIALYTASGSIGEGFASYSFRSNDNDVDFEILNSTIRYTPTNSSTPQASDYYTVLHEIGHSLTLQHVHPTSLPNHPPNPPSQFQDNLYTVMHYQGNTDDGNINIVRQSENEFFYRHFQLLDIYALQVRYGANMDTFAGNTVHDTSSLIGDGDQNVLWDASGIDVIDARSSNFNQSIDLAPGSFSIIGVPARPYNFAIAYGADIENARSGNGDDLLFGNDLANRLEGGGGRDFFEGKGGDDRIIGGSGTDVAFFDGRISGYRITNLGGGNFEVADRSIASIDTGTDVVSGVEILQFHDAEFNTSIGTQTIAFPANLSYQPESTSFDTKITADRNAFRRFFAVMKMN